MDELSAPPGKSQREQHAETTGNVLPLFDPKRAPRRPAVHVNDAEILEYRRIRPQLLQMLEEWQLVRTVCPLASRIVGGDE